MKKVLLLSTNQASAPYPVPPIGLALLAQILKKEYQVLLVDGFNLNKKQFQTQLQTFDPDFICVSIRNIDEMTKGDSHSYIPEIKYIFIDTIHRYSRAPVILGGSGFTIFPKELMTLFKADYGIAGEAEERLPKLLAALLQGKDPAKLEGIITHKKTQTVPQNYMELSHPFNSELDTVLDYSPYKQRSTYPIQTKRGCIHNCIYCSYPVLEGITYRLRNIDHIVDEIEETAKRFSGADLTFEFVDSTFNDPPGHAEAICKEIIKRKLTVNLRTMGMNPVNITGELILLMKKAGFSQIDSTPDSASPTILKKYNKNFSLEQLHRAAEIIRKHQMPTMWFFIFGGPGETEETLSESFQFIDNYIHPEDMVHITEGLRIYPNTPLANLAIREKIIDKDQSLLAPTFYVSPKLGDKKLGNLITEKITTRPNCIRITESKPPPELLAAALKERMEKKLTEPMFRTLLRLKRQWDHHG